MPKELGSSPYYYLVKDKDFKRWFDNIKRWSAKMASEWFRYFFQSYLPSFLRRWAFNNGNGNNW